MLQSIKNINKNISKIIKDKKQYYNKGKLTNNKRNNK